MMAVLYHVDQKIPSRMSQIVRNVLVGSTPMSMLNQENVLSRGMIDRNTIIVKLYKSTVIHLVECSF